MSIKVERQERVTFTFAVTIGETHHNATLAELKELRDACDAALRAHYSPITQEQPASLRVEVGDKWDAVIDGEPPAHVLVLDDRDADGLRYLHRLDSGRWAYSRSALLPPYDHGVGFVWDASHFPPPLRMLTVINTQEV